mgnify:CR=1 FL=1|jgi:hypothetical protein|tara:strand:+ start:3199 stop:4365 length:1167 start_codon:yes stop_codon:yes gene_type:complete
MKLKIKKPNDSSEYYFTEIKSERATAYGDEAFITYDRSAKDPIHGGLFSFWNASLSTKSRGSSYFSMPKHGDYNAIIMIGSCPVAIEKRKNRYYINGKAESLTTVCHALARVTYKSCFEKDASKLLLGLYNTLAIPENIKYVLENRLPFTFHEYETKYDVRLPVQMVGTDEVAIEIADGVWGTMPLKTMDKLCSFLVEGKKRSKLKFISPRKLYSMTMDREPLDSELKVMIEFLKQNRMKDLVEKRAIQLVNDLLAQHPKRLKAEYEEDTLHRIYIHGKEFDWMLENNRYKSDIQMVSTYIWQPVVSFEKVLNDEGEPTGEEIKIVNSPKWQGPICIDNMSKGSPLGDQFAARALALLNDTFTITIVNTIKRYIVADANEYRVDFNEM